MEKEIAQAVARYEREKLELLEEIERRELRAATERCDAERSELLAEIARREAQRDAEGTTQEEGTPREGGGTPRTPRERRHAIRLRKTLAQRVANGIDPQEIIEINALNNTQELKSDVAIVKQPSSKSLRKEAMRHKNTSLRAVSRNATRKNLWLAEVPKPQVQVGH